MEKTIASPAAGIYIHIPFCVKKCLYCDFYSETALSRRSEFVSHLIEELSLRQSEYPVDTLYFGGGTPSVMDPDSIGTVVDTIRRLYRLSPDAEITLEVNPGTLDRTALDRYLAMGVNRLNIGVQSFNDKHLTLLGRVHTADAACRAIADARDAGFKNIGLDFIYALPGQSVQAVLDDLQRAVAFSPEHLSCYMLTVEPGTPLEHGVKSGDFTPLDEEQTADHFRLVSQFINTNGYAQYEISNFSRISRANGVDYRSKHNLKYWNHYPYRGFGPSAHSFIDNRRSWNHQTLDAYESSIDGGLLPVAGEEVLTREQQFTEFIYLGLRQTDGIDVQEFERRFDVSFYQWFQPVFEQLRPKDLFRNSSERCALTLEGQLIMDGICRIMVDRNLQPNL
ncbi:MAG: radical SAM family heme chaperone HemW [Desulfobacteraceae bacterium]|nr:radical SAM family heme chaperone HemW [Desulfobacteraceae bacterium]